MIIIEELNLLRSCCKEETQRRKQPQQNRKESAEMRFSSVMELFHDHILVCSCSDPDREILYAIPFSSTIQFDVSTSVAIGSVTDFSLLTSREYENVVLISSAPLADFDDIPDNINFLCLHADDVTLSRDNILSIISYAVRACDDLKTALFSRHSSLSLSGFMNIAAEKLRIPLLFLDSNGKVIDCAKMRFVESWQQYLEENRADIGAQLPNCISLPHDVIQQKCSSLVSCELLSFFALPLQDDKTSHGVLVAVSEKDPFTQISRCLLHEFSLFLASTITRLPRQVAPGDALSYLLRTCLLSQVKEISDEYNKTLSGKGWKTNDRFCVYCVLFPEEASDISMLNSYRESLEQKLPMCFFLENRDRLYMIQNLSIPPRMRRREAIAGLQQVLADSSATIGTSNSYAGITSTYIARLQSEIAIDIGRILDDGKRSYEYDRYESFHLLMNTSARMDVSMLIHPLVSLLVTYDKENGTEYTETLHAYLDANMRPSVAANKLCIHKNTMDYRLRRLHEITHPRFEEPERVLAFKLSFAIFTYLEHADEFEKLRRRYDSYKNKTVT